MTIFQNLRPMTRDRMAQLSLPDIRTYAKAYKVPADVIEHGTVDELLDFVFKLRPCHPKEYPINTPHLFTHEIAYAHVDRDEEFVSHKPHTGVIYRRNLASFRRAKNSISRPSPPEQGNQAEEAAEEQYQVGRIGVESYGGYTLPLEGLPVMDQPVAPKNMAPTHEQPNVKATIPSNDDPAPYRSEKSAPSRMTNLNHAPEEREEPRSKPPRIIVDDELFHLEFNPDMTRAGKEAIIHERYAIAMSNHKMIGQILAEAETGAKQALWKLAVLQPQLYAAHENAHRLIDEFRALTGRHDSDLVMQAIYDCKSLAKDAWELDWNEEWIFTQEDEKEEGRMREIAQARAAGVQVPPSPPTPVPHSRKRVREEYEDELEYADEDEPQVGTSEPDPKRPRVGSRGTSTAPPSPSPKRKGKSRTLVAEDSYTLPFPSSSFHIPPPPIPRFGPKDRCDIYPVYNPAFPGYEIPRPPEADDGKMPGERGGDRLPPSHMDDNSQGGPEVDPGQAEGQNREERIGEGQGHDEFEEAGERNRGATENPLRGAPPPTLPQPKVPQPGNPWQVLRYGRLVWQGYSATDHTRMPSELKRPVNWSVMGSRHPKGASYREWDDDLEKQNPWHQGGRPILKQQ